MFMRQNVREPKNLKCKVTFIFKTGIQVSFVKIFVGKFELVKGKYLHFRKKYLPLESVLKFICKFCEQSFNCEKNLSFHMRRHEGIELVSKESSLFIRFL